MSSDLNPVLAPSALGDPVKSPPPAPLSAGLRRFWLVLYLLFCAELGGLLIILPWTSVWKANRFLADFPAARTVFESYFMRGLVGGLGFVDLYLGAAAIVQHVSRARDRKAAPPQP